MNNTEDLKSKIRDLRTLLDAITDLNSEIELNTVLANSLTVMCQVVKAQAGTLWLVDQEEGFIKAEVATGSTADKILNVRLKKGEGIVGRVILSRQSELVKDVTQDANWAKRVDQNSGFITRSVMTVPLRAKDEVIGAMQLLNKQDEMFFSEEDLKLAEALANNAALAIHNSRLYDDIQRFSVSVIRSLALALDARDPYTAGHSERVSQYSQWIAEKLELSLQQRRELEWAALMHDIGKIAVPDHILGKPGRLTDEEFEIMRQHPVNASKILSQLEPKYVSIIAQEVARNHHEKVNGTGYPDGLTSDNIPLFSKIVSIADAFDAMTTDRPYSKGRSFKEAVEELVRCKDTHFEAVLVDVFSEVMQNRSFLVNNQERTTLNESL